MDPTRVGEGRERRGSLLEDEKREEEEEEEEEGRHVAPSPLPGDGGSTRKEAPPRGGSTTATCGVWGDLDDWHHTLDLIALKWGAAAASSSYYPSPSASASSPAPGRRPGHDGGRGEEERERSSSAPQSGEHGDAAAVGKPEGSTQPQARLTHPSDDNVGRSPPPPPALPAQPRVRSALSRGQKGGEEEEAGAANAPSLLQEGRGEPDAVPVAGTRPVPLRPSSVTARSKVTNSNGDSAEQEEELGAGKRLQTGAGGSNDTGEGAGPVIASRKQRYGGRAGANSLPRPSDVEALLRKAAKETKRQRPSSNAPSLVSSSSSPAALPSAATACENESDASAAAGNSTTPQSGYSAANDLRNAFVSVNHQAAGGVPNNEGVVLSLQELQKRPVPPTLNKAALETYLSDDEFASALGMPRDQFYSLRAWKQTQVKKKAGLL